MGKLTDVRDDLARALAYAASRSLKEREAGLDALRAAVVEGEAGGPAKPFDFDAFIDAKRKPRRR